MRILMLCPQVSNSSFLVSYSYGEILSKYHDVTFMGPDFGMKHFTKLADNKIKIVNPDTIGPVQVGMVNLFFKNLKILSKMKDDYDVIHAFKLLPHTAPVAAAIKKKFGKKFVLTIDDYDPASPKNPLKRVILKMSESSYKKADRIMVSSRMLQKIYGGEIIYQVSDEKMFNPRKANGKYVRKKLGLENKIIVTHIGTLFEHKGIDILIKAVQKLGRDDIKLVLFESGANIEKYKSMSGDETVWVKQIDFKDVPEYTAACDIYAIPTRDTPYARAETPRKIFDAMVMGKAVIASKMSDVSVFLDNGKCGILVKPGDVEALSSAIGKLADNKKLRKSLGAKARKFYMKKFSYSQLEKKILGIYSGL